MKFLLTIISLSCTLLSVCAQSNSTTSAAFNVHTPQDDTPPQVHISADKHLLHISLSDQVGLDTLWFNEDIIIPPKDTSYTFSRPKSHSNMYWLKATDLKGNTYEETFALDERGQLQRGVIPVSQPKAIVSMFDASYYALMIGVQNYEDDEIEDLTYPVEDMIQLSHTLINLYTFEPENVQLLSNPTKSEIERKLDELKEIVGEQDNLLIFYAGHGYWNEDSQTGSWLPANARLDKASTWVRNSTVRDYIKEINSKHTLLITDACFGGSIFSSRGISSDELMTYNALYNAPSRRAMTSGNLQTVPDQSKFMSYLLAYLADNRDDFFPAENLFNRLKLPVINNTNQATIPQYGVIQDVGDEGGDFIFIKRQASATKAPE